MLTLRYFGHDCWQIEDGTYKVLIDPFLTGNPKAAATPDAFTSLDAILVTHGHSDHLGDAVEISKRIKAPVISNYEIVGYVESKGGTGHPLHIGRTAVSLRPREAHHRPPRLDRTRG